jgi:hypothetical protein
MLLFLTLFKGTCRMILTLRRGAQGTGDQGSLTDENVNQSLVRRRIVLEFDIQPTE